MNTDEYYKNFILNTKFLKQVSKDIYIKKINDILRNVTSYISIHELLNNPDVYENELYEYFVNNKGLYNKEMSDHTKESYITPILALFYHNMNLKENNVELFGKWKKLHGKFREPIMNKYKKNEPTERQKESYISYDNIVKIRNDLPKGSFERLLLMMYTEIPPVRSDYYRTRIINDEKNIGNEENTIIMRKDNSSILFLHKYKTSSIYGTIYIDIPKLLYEEIKASIEKYPREYLFVSKLSGEVFNKENSYTQWANRTLKKVLNNNLFSLTMLRHIYISRRDINIERQSGIDREKIAKIMGHSVETQQKYLWHTWLDMLTINESTNCQ